MATTMSRATAESRFDQARYIPRDAIFALTAQYLEDPFPQKVNLGQGTYRDDDGKPWILSSVNKARETILAQGLTHEYLPILGMSTFQQAVVKLVLGPELSAERESKVLSKASPTVLKGLPG
jgi:aspartate aminotransferase